MLSCCFYCNFEDPCFKQPPMNVALSKLPLQIHKSSHQILQCHIFPINLSTHQCLTQYHGDVDKWLHIFCGSPKSINKPQTTGLVHSFTSAFILHHFFPKASSFLSLNPPWKRIDQKHILNVFETKRQFSCLQLVLKGLKQELKGHHLF